ncbi:MAG: hypothetical protein WCO45_11275 [Pseudanabaena sp. ELA607]|jgi:hypothetical protein
MDKLLVSAKYLLIADYRSLYGNAYETDELKNDAKITAGVLSGANLIDFCLSQSTLNFACAGMGWIGVFVALLANFGLMFLKNKGGELSARKREGSHLLSMGGFFTLVSLSAISSIASGIGAELTNNQSGLVQIKTAQIIEKEAINLKSRNRPIKAEYEMKQQVLNSKKIELSKMSENDPNRDRAILEISGTYYQRHGGPNNGPAVNWDTYSDKDLPLDQLVPRLKKRVDLEEQAISGDWEKKLAKRSEIGNDLLFVKQELPNLYAQHFKNDEEFRSGTEAIEIAAFNFFSNLSKGDFSKIAMSLFFASLSIATSIGACTLVIVFANNKEAQMSWSEAVRDERDRLLYEMEKPPAQTNPSNEERNSSRSDVPSHDLAI